MKTRVRPDVALGVECAWPDRCTGTGIHGCPHRAVRWRRGLRITTAVAMLAIGAWQFGHGAWIQTKAWLAQALIAHAWSRTLAGGRDIKPWPWADTWPVARLIVPSLGIERYVLSGTSGEAMAFGPGHLEGTARPGGAGNSVIGGHRDTHLAFLRDLPVGSEILLETADGKRSRYTVRYTMVLDQGDVWIAKQEGPTRLTLITCYPFDALRAGGRQRYAVSAFADDATNKETVRGNALAPPTNRGGERAVRG